MSSRKSAKASRASGRKSSKRDNTKSSTDTNYSKTDLDTHTPLRSRAVLNFAFTVLFQGLIIYYLYNLESVDCNCIRDWRHNYIKYFAIFLIVCAGICVIIPSLSNKYMVFTVLTMILSIVNMYAFFTYIGDLNTTQCSCDGHKQPTLNSYMNFIRWVQVILIPIGVISFIWLLFTLRNISKAT